MIYVSLDPGKTTGVCIWEDSHFVTNQITAKAAGFGEWLDQLQRMDVLIYESFQYRRLPNVELTAVELIGVVKYWAYSKDVHVMAQPPSSKTLWDDKKLRRVELYKPNAPHANDAARHMLYYISNLPPNNFLRKEILNKVKVT